jgi:hypothetical protein
MSQQETLNKIIARTRQNESFKQELLRNPKAALTKEGIHIPEGVEITVFEETPTSLVLVLPMTPNRQELAESELEAVSGGAAATQGLDFEGPIPSWD